MRLGIPIKTVSEANVREHWAPKSKRAKQQRAAAFMVLHTAPKEITLTRIAPKKLDSDNLSRSLKSTRDGIADWLGVDDGDPRIFWSYAQRAGRHYAVEVNIECIPEGA